MKNVRRENQIRIYYNEAFQIELKLFRSKQLFKYEIKTYLTLESVRKFLANIRKVSDKHNLRNWINQNISFWDIQGAAERPTRF